MWSPFNKTAKGSGSSSKSSATDRVLTLSSQGMSEQQIIQTLRNEGYNPTEVDHAMRDALRASATPSSRAPPTPGRRMPPRNIPPETRRDMRSPDMVGMDSDFDDSMQPPAPDRSEVPDSLRMHEFSRNDDLRDLDSPGRMDDDMDDDLDLPPPRRMQEFDDQPDEIPKFTTGRRTQKREKHRELEEIAEGIADEKWSEFKAESTDIRHELKELSDRIVVLERSMIKIQEQKASEMEEIKNTINNYKGSINQVGERMEGMEKALKDSLNPMMETLRSLSETVKVKVIKKEKA